MPSPEAVQAKMEEARQLVALPDGYPFSYVWNRAHHRAMESRIAAALAEERERTDSILRWQCWKVAEIATERLATEKWDEEDKGEECVSILEEAGFDILFPVDEPSVPTYHDPGWAYSKKQEIADLRAKLEEAEEQSKLLDWDRHNWEKEAGQTKKLLAEAERERDAYRARWDRVVRHFGPNWVAFIAREHPIPGEEA